MSAFDLEFVEKKAVVSLKVHDRLKALERVHEFCLQKPVSGSHPFTITDLLTAVVTLGVTVMQFDCPEVALSCCS